jgi:hypothetical protein
VTVFDPVAALVPAAFVAVDVQEYVRPATFVPQEILWLLYEASPLAPRDAVHEYVRVGPPFDDTHDTCTEVRAWPPEDAPVTLTPRS